MFNLPNILFLLMGTPIKDNGMKEIPAYPSGTLMLLLNVGEVISIIKSLKSSKTYGKDNHFIGSTDRISIFGLRPYDNAIRNLRRIGHTDPRKYLTGANPKYEPLLYYGFCNQYAIYHEHECNNDPPWDPYDNYPSNAPNTD